MDLFDRDLHRCHRGAFLLLGMLLGGAAIGRAAHFELLHQKDTEAEVRRLNLVIQCQAFAISQAGDLMALAPWSRARKLMEDAGENRRACETLKKMDSEKALSTEVAQ